MFKKESSGEQALEELTEPSAAPAGPAKQSDLAPVGSQMMMIGVVPLALFVIFVLLSFAGIGSGIIGIVLLAIGAGGFFFMWKKATDALNASLDALRDEAYAVANDDLPRLGHAISTGAPISEIANTRTSATFQDPAFASVASGLTAVRESAGGIGGSVSELQKGISDTYVNLARRNQAMVDRQLEAIDTLEAEERDSDKLALLYRVDHLATRMHRNAESLLVLADAKTPERHSPAVALREVLRVAIGEVEDYRRIVPIALDEITVAGPKAQDMAHLLAELMENSAQHSPPGTAVDVTGSLDTRTGDYAITILDHGTGMAADQLASLNQLLERPPTSTLTISHSIGLQVVSRIANSLGIKVVLNSAADGGIITTVTVPAAVVARWNQVTPGQASAPAATPVAPTAAAPVAPAPVAPAPVAPAAAAPVAPAAAAPVAPAAAAPVGAPDSFPTVGIEQQAAPTPSPFTMPAPQPVTEAPAPAAAAPVAPVAPPVDEPKVFEPGNSTFKMPTKEVVAEAPAAPVVAPEPTAPSAAELKADPTPGPGTAPEAPETSAAPLVGAATATAAAAATTLGGSSPATTEAPAEAAQSSGGALTKRNRSKPSGNPAASLDEVRTAPSTRSPDQVKSMLSRYKSGLERGRGPAETDGES